MVQGLNQTVPYAGLKFHVQTEHLSTGDRQQVVSQVFFGGTIVSSRRTVLGKDVDCRENDRLRAAVKLHHRTLVGELIAGGFDQRIADTPGTEEFRRVGASEDPAPAEGQSSPSAAEAARRFRAGVELLQQVLEQWQAATQLDPQRPAYKAATGLISRLVSAVAVAVAQTSEAMGDSVAPAPPVEPQGEPPQAAADTQTSPSSETDDLPALTPEQCRAVELYEYGLQAMQHRNYPDALCQLQQAAQLDPDNVRYASAIARVHRLSQR